MRIAINGFGRIGRTLLRQLLIQVEHHDIEIVAINDIASAESCAYLYKYDSVFGPYPGEVRLEPEALIIAGRHIPLTHMPNLADLDLPDVDILMECTGKVKTRDQAEQFRHTGARNLLLSGPCPAADVTCVLGANEAQLGDATIVSNASCTTNALAPLLKELDARFSIEHGHMTTIHVYTGSQPTVDAPRGENLVRSRAAAVSMVPTTTSAMKLIDQVLPDLAGKVSGAAVRVPAISVSAVDLTVTLNRMPDDFNADLRDLARGNTVLGLVEDPCVSSDLKARPESLIVAPLETRITGSQVRVFGWYDNEWGFSARMIDMARLMAKRTNSKVTNERKEI